MCKNAAWCLVHHHKVMHVSNKVPCIRLHVDVCVVPVCKGKMSEGKASAAKERCQAEEGGRESCSKMPASAVKPVWALCSECVRTCAHWCAFAQSALTPFKVTVSWGEHPHCDQRPASPAAAFCFTVSPPFNLQFLLLSCLSVQGCRCLHKATFKEQRHCNGSVSDDPFLFVIQYYLNFVIISSATDLKWSQKVLWSTFSVCFSSGLANA